MPLNSFDSLRPLSDANARHFYDLNSAERAGAALEITVTPTRGLARRLAARARIDTPIEVDWIYKGGLLSCILADAAEEHRRSL